MKEDEAIEYLENLEIGNFITVNMQINGDTYLPVTAMYLGKTPDGLYNFADTGKFKVSPKFIKEEKIVIDKEYDGDKAFEIYAKVKRETEKKKNRDVR